MTLRPCQGKDVKGISADEIRRTQARVSSEQVGGKRPVSGDTILYYSVRVIMPNRCSFQKVSPAFCSLITESVTDR
jgi:hypothetical protein